MYNRKALGQRVSQTPKQVMAAFTNPPLMKTDPTAQKWSPKCTAAFKNICLLTKAKSQINI